MGKLRDIIVNAPKSNSNTTQVVNLMTVPRGGFDSRFEMLKIVPFTLDQSSGRDLIIQTTEPERPHMGRINGYMGRFQGSASVKEFIIAVAWCEETQSFFFVNGKHSVNRALSDPEFCYPAVLFVFRVETKQDLCDLYAAYDDPISSKSKGQVAKAKRFGMADGAFNGCSVKVINAISAGLSLHEFGMDKCDWSQGERIQLMAEEKYIDLSLWLAEFLRGCDYSFLTRSGVIYSLVCADKVDPKDCREFINQVRSGAGLDEGDPALELRNFFLYFEQKRTNTRTKTSGNRTIDDVHFVLEAWIARRQGRSVSLTHKTKLSFESMGYNDLSGVIWEPDPITLLRDVRKEVSKPGAAKGTKNGQKANKKTTAKKKAATK